MPVNDTSSTVVYGIERWLITATVMMVSILEVLDMTVVTVAMPHMMGSLGANSDQITWILTSYIVSSAIVMLMTGFLVDRIGRRRLLMINITGFLFCSIFCGISLTLPQIVFFRTMQGVFGASLIPLSQVILRDAFPRDETGKAMAIWGIGIMVAPILGPSIGGYITESWNWRWIFFMNIPFCALAIIMALKLIKETPRTPRFIDWLGIILMTVGVGGLQMLLDRGNHEGWLESKLIQVMCIIVGITLVLLTRHCIKHKDAIINLRIFSDKNFSVSTCMMLFFGIGMFGSLSIQPLMLETIMHYPATTTGMLMAPRGIASMIGMGLTAAIINRFDPRAIVATGIIFTTIGTYVMCFFSPDTSQFFLMWSAAVQGMGMGLFFVPLSSLAFDTLNESDVDNAAGLFNFARNLGSAMGISILNAIITHQSQTNWNRLGSYINPYNPNLSRFLHDHHLTLQDPKTWPLLAQQLATQANMIAFLDVFWAATLCFLIMLPFVLILKRSEGPPKMMH